MKRQIEDIRTYLDEMLNATSIDLYFEGTEEGEVAAEVCMDTGKVFYRDNIYRSNNRVQEAIKGVQADVKMTIPKVVAVVNGGVITSVVGDAPIDIHVIDYDHEGEDPDDCYEIPQDGDNTETAVAYIGEIFEEDADRTYELLEAINR